MRKKKLISFEIIEKVVAGEPEAPPLLLGSQEDEISKLLSPSIYYGGCYAVGVVLYLIYVDLQALK